MTGRIETTTAGSLPRTPELIAANRARTFADDGFTLQRTPEFDALVAGAVGGLVAQQKAAGLTLVGDGEFGKAMSSAVDYGAWWSYSFQRVSGLSLTEENALTQAPVHSEPGHIRLTSFTDRRDRGAFPAVYADAETVPTGRVATPFPSATGPLRYIDQEAVAADIANLKAALAANDLETGFITSIAPGSAARVLNQHYATEKDYVWAWAEALREEYVAIIEAGLVLQIDDPSLAENWDQINPEPSIEDYRAFSRENLEALNWALRDLPQDQIRYHLCWGSWHGPHTTDLEFRHIIDLMLSVNAGAYSFEAANARHEHEWKLWRDVELPAGKKILPGVVGHSTNVVEHPELVADRIEAFASVVGPQNVIASTDCGLGGRVHPDIAWAKVASLTEGARIASERLFG
ncbi:cobalamin-independent methionine synthase II family protein [Salinibacterium sp. ZJ77]|uniref:cobalamin-independent methionine synthase II family protein n=1 Tax=Salinibacterium sp. ZJ77 TaxID=2708337 RepID=UPI0014242F3A|nr:cobalamin-independent methionine synthase II family protein [Salinibacterium sp. ZJ77]